MIVSNRQAVEAWELLRIYPFLDGVKWGDTNDGQGTVDTITEEDVTTAYRIAAKHTHPDKGGTLEKFAAVDRAKHVLLHWIPRRGVTTATLAAETCPVCEGNGFIRQNRGFAGSLRRQCARCKGSGDLAFDHDTSSGGDS